MIPARSIDVAWSRLFLAADLTPGEGDRRVGAGFPVFAIESFR
jgi:hypothetical protein